MDSKNVVKISDFGVSKHVPDPSNDLIRGTEGTHQFCSPECLGVNGVDLYSGKAADIWSLGVCLYVYTFLRLPFSVVFVQPKEVDGTPVPAQDSAIVSLFNLIKEGAVDMKKERRTISPELEDLIN